VMAKCKLLHFILGLTLNKALWTWRIEDRAATVRSEHLGQGHACILRCAPGAFVLPGASFASQCTVFVALGSYCAETRRSLKQNRGFIPIRPASRGASPGFWHSLLLAWCFAALIMEETAPYEMVVGGREHFAINSIARCAGSGQNT